MLLHLCFRDPPHPEAVCSPAGWKKKKRVPNEQERTRWVSWSCWGFMPRLTWTPAERSGPNEEQSVLT